MTFQNVHPTFVFTDVTHTLTACLRLFQCWGGNLCRRSTYPQMWIVRSILSPIERALPPLRICLSLILDSRAFSSAYGVHGWRGSGISRDNCCQYPFRNFRGMQAVVVHECNDMGCAAHFSNGRHVIMLSYWVVYCSASFPFGRRICQQARSGRGWR